MVFGHGEDIVVGNFAVEAGVQFAEYNSNISIEISTIGGVGEPVIATFVGGAGKVFSGFGNTKMMGGHVIDSNHSPVL